MPLTGPMAGYLLSATPYIETTTLLFLHVLAAMATMGGVLGVLVLYLRARAARDVDELRTTVALLGTFSQWLLQPAIGLTGLLGILLAWRFDAHGLFSLSRQGWLLVALVLWGILQAVAARAAGAALAAISPLGTDGGLLESKARLRSTAITALIWLTLIVIVAIVYLMIFRPFVRS